MTYIRCYSITRTILTALKSSVLCLFILALSDLTATELFIVSIVLPFPECHIVAVTWCVAFVDGLLSLSYMQLGLVHAFS